MIKILIVQDIAFLRDSLAGITNGQKDMRVVGAAADAGEALILCRCENLAPDLALIGANAGNGLASGNEAGIAAAAEIRRELPDVKIVIMTAEPDIPFMDAARNAGAHSFVRADSGIGHLLYVIRRTVSGRGIYPGPDDPGAGNGAIIQPRFSDEEAAVIRLICKGKSRSEIASSLAMSQNRVNAIITGVMSKTGFDSVRKFSVYAVSHGFVAADR